MRRTSPVVVVACLVLVVSVVVVPTMAGSLRSSPESPAVVSTQPTPTNNTTARLTLPEYRVTQSAFETVRIGMGSTLQGGSDSVRFEHHRITVEQRFESVGSVREKRHVVDVALTDLKDRSKALAARERAAIGNYSDGSITGETLVRELARIDASAREIETSLDVLRGLAASEGITVFDGRIKGVRYRAESLQGPVRHRVARAMAGDVPEIRVFVTTSDTGVVLSALAGDSYVREATDHRFRRLDDQNTLVSAIDRAGELYPWAWDEDNNYYRDVEGALTANIYRISVTHPQGELVAYMDTGSEEVFHEVQTLTVEDMPTTSTVNRSENGLRVTLHRTYEGGPLDVFVEDATTGAAINGEITVGGHVLGRTGTDGHLRTIEPRDRYTVNVSNGETTLSFTVDPNETEG